jgi:hypothetical protein
MEEQEGTQVNPQRVINSLLRQLSDTQLKVSVLECLIEQMREESMESPLPD